VLEGIIIEVAEPPMNNQGARFGKRVERYIQVDDSVDPSEETTTKIRHDIQKLDEKMDRIKRQLKRAIRKVSK
jgi:DNA-directed RNA polymerase subunit L